MRYSASIQTGRAFTLALLLLCGTAHAAGNDARLPLRIGPHVFQVERAATPQQRARGLMGRTHLAADGGMLFVFEQPGRHCFWMRDTPLPLSIAFIDAKGRIINIEDMAPQVERTTWSTAPALYALEMKKGWFAQKGIGPGAEVKGLPPAAKR